MKMYNFSITIVENEDDARSAFMSLGVEPDVGQAIVSGCFDGEDCTKKLVTRKDKQSYHAAVSEMVQKRINDEVLFTDNPKIDDKSEG